MSVTELLLRRTATTIILTHWSACNCEWICCELWIPCNCRRKAYRFHADIVMSLEDIFGYFRTYLLENQTDFGQNLAEGWGTGKEWSCKFFGEIAPEAPAEEGQNTDLFVLNTTHPFGHFRFSDLRETWQEYMNQCSHESFRGEIFCKKISVKKSLFSKNWFFR